MKKILLMLVAFVALSLTSCGIGTYTVSGGMADEAAVCFTANEEYIISVNVDGTTYQMETIEDNAYKANRKIKETANNQITLSPGRHKVVVTKDGSEIYSKDIFLSASEVKVIEL